MSNSDRLMLDSIKTDAATSTPRSDKKPTVLIADEFGKAIKALQEGALGFADSIIKDPAARADYIKMTKAASDELVKLVRDRSITPHEGARLANAMRNDVMEMSRATLSSFGLSISKDIKADGLTLKTLEEKYALTEFGGSFDNLIHAEREVVWRKIVIKAGGARSSMNWRASAYGVAGKAFLVASLAFAVYDISTADDKPRQAAKEGAVLGTSIVGGAAAGVGIALVLSSPPGWVVGAAIFVGAAVSGIGVEAAFDYLWPEKRP